MFDADKRQIGVCFVGHNLKVGPIVGALVSVKPDFFRGFSFMDFKPASELSPVKLNKIVELTQKHVMDFKIVRIDPPDFRTENIIETEFKREIEMLNTQYRFWMQNLAIHNPYPNLSDEEYIAGIKFYLPQNLKKTELKLESWEVGHDWKKVTMLANCYAEYHLKNIIADLKSVWGDFGQGVEGDSKTKEFLVTNPTCPAIRDREWM